MQLRLLSLFSGIGAFEKALGDKVELVNYCEIDKYAAKAYSLIHNVPEDLNLKDVTKVDTSKLHNIDMVTYGFPCVPKGYMIKVENGYKAIEDITNNDLVLTHNNQYKRVVKTMSRVSNHINHIKLIGCPDLQLTDEHPLYVLRNGEFTWVKAKDLNKETDYLCYNINNKSIPCDYSDAVLWLIGRYFADGYKENHSLHRPIFCIGKDKIEEFETYIKPFKFSIAHRERSAVQYKITDDYLCGIFSSLTTGSTTKEIPQWIVDLPKQQLEVFYKGYFSGDGHSRKDRELYMFCTVSKNMFLALQDIVIKLYNVVPTVSIRHDTRKATYNDTYNAQYSYRPKGQIVKDSKVCVKIKDVIRELKDIEVFNFEVEEDNSYTVNNIIVHNCQDISNAGKRQGFVDSNGNLTRSGLFFEALRIIKDTQPKYAIAENVKNLVSKKFRTEFETVISELDKAGYISYYDVLNAKDYGIPQNRERVFIVSIRKDLHQGFNFPKGEPLKLRLKDLLEPEVDSHYYHNDDRTKRFLEKLNLSNVSNEPNIQRVGGYTNYLSAQVISPSGISKTIAARDYKDAQSIIQIGNYLESKGGFSNKQNGRIYDPKGLAPTLRTFCGGNQESKILLDNIKIRKLTPLECWRLMGFEDTDFWKVKNSGISNSQLYKMAGNSIVVNVLRAIFRELLNE